MANAKAFLLLGSIAVALVASAPNLAFGAGGEVLVRIGLVGPLTGSNAHLGKDNENGARMAIDEANARNLTLSGRKATFVLISEDDQGDPQTATTVAQKLVDLKVNGIIGHLNSGTTIPASKIYSDAGIPQISPSATAAAYTQQGFKTAFRVVANDLQQGKVAGDFATGALTAKTIAIVDDATSYGQGLADEFEKAVKTGGARVVTRDHTTNAATDFMAVLTRIKGKNVDLLFYGGMDAQSGPMLKQMKMLGVGAKFMTGSGGRTAQLIKLAGDAAEGAFGSKAGLPVESMPKGGAFKASFERKYGEIQNYAPYCYDAVNVMIEAMRKSDSADPERYLPELAKTSYNGVTGKIEFNDKGDLKVGYVTVSVVQGGKWEPLESVSGK